MSRSTADWAGPIVAYAAVIAVNTLSNTLPINDQSMPEISAKYESLFTPAGFTFAIWGVIYLCLAGYVVYQALPSTRDDSTLSALSRPFQLTCALNIAWILAWHYDLLAFSMLIMLALLATLIRIYRMLMPLHEAATLTTRVLVLLPFSLYTAWISLATLANASALQTSYGWSDAGLSAVNWTLLKLAIAGALGATMIGRFRDIAFALVVTWAAYGIAANNVAWATTASGDIASAEGRVFGGAAAVLTLVALLVATDILRRIARGR